MWTLIKSSFSWKLLRTQWRMKFVYRYPMHCTKVKSLLNGHLIFGFKAVNSHCQLVMFNISLYFASRVDGACYKVLIFARSSMPFCWLTACSEPLPMTTAGKEEALLLNDSQGNKKGKKGEKTTWSVWQTFRAALWVITIHIPGCLAPLSLFPSTNLTAFHRGRALWLWKRGHKINIRESDRSRGPDQVRVNGAGPEAGLFMLTWSYPLRECAVLSGVQRSRGGGEGGQRARLLTDLIYQPWRSQLVGDLKTRWRRAENDENVEAERFNKAWAFKKMFLNKFTDSTTQTRQRSISIKD